MRSGESGKTKGPVAAEGPPFKLLLGCVLGTTQKPPALNSKHVGFFSCDDSRSLSAQLPGVRSLVVRIVREDVSADKLSEAQADAQWVDVLGCTAPRDGMSCRGEAQKLQ